MGHYERKYPDAPTAEEVKTGYAPSTIKGSPFVKFLFWTFAGLAITYAATYGVVLGLDRIQEAEDARYERMAARRPAEFKGPPLQPSPGHPNIDWLDTAEMYDRHNTELVRKHWTSEPGKYWKTGISEAVVLQTVKGIEEQKKAAPATKPTASVE